MARDTSKDMTKEQGIGCLAIIGVVLLLALLGKACGGDDSGGGGGSDAPSVGSEFGAKDVCEQFVEDRLKSPSSADFNDETAIGPGPAWTVAGNVDSENGFGAMLRSYFVCKVRFTGEDDSGENYSLVNLNLG